MTAREHAVRASELAEAVDSAAVGGGQFTEARELSRMHSLAAIALTAVGRPAIARTVSDVDASDA